MLKEKLLKTIQTHGMLKPHDRVLAGVSGGADSTALLCILAELKETLGISLQVAHLNHLIRGKAAERDAEYVRKLALKLGLPIIIETLDVPRLAKEKKLSLEDAGREARYDFFERAAAKVKATKIALGHTADDNIETFLMWLLRGAGGRGLRGIPPVRGKIIRPLIKVFRKEIENYCTTHHLQPRTDYTNYKTNYLRNRIRRDLIPQLKAYNPNFKQVLLNTIEIISGDLAYLEDEARKKLAGMRLKSGDGLEIDLKKFLKLPTPLQAHVLRCAIEEIKGDLKELSFKHIYDILGHLDSPEWQLSLPGKICIKGDKKSLRFFKGRMPSEKKVVFRHKFQVPGEVKIPEIDLTIKGAIYENIPKLKITNPFQAYLDFEKAGPRLIVRSRKIGDRFSPLGLKGSKKLQDIFVDLKVPLTQRDRIPVIENGRHIVWLPGYRIDERVKVNPETRRILVLTVEGGMI